MPRRCSQRFAFTGLLLGAIGIYGTISDHVTERRREIGVRMALGAQGRDVIRTVVGGTFLVVACGAGIGVAIAAARDARLRNAAVRRHPGRCLDLRNRGASSWRSPP